MYSSSTFPPRTLPAVATALLIVGAGAVPASARPDSGEVRVIHVETATHHCLLERVGTQFVRCDHLTGDGVPAPGWIPEF